MGLPSPPPPRGQVIIFMCLLFQTQWLYFPDQVGSRLKRSEWKLRNDSCWYALAMNGRSVDGNADRIHGSVQTCEKRLAKRLNSLGQTELSPLSRGMMVSFVMCKLWWAGNITELIGFQTTALWYISQASFKLIRFESFPCILWFWIQMDDTHLGLMHSYCGFSGIRFNPGFTFDMDPSSWWASINWHSVPHKASY